MKLNKVAKEQQIAVFGESGSGKTVLLSSFYGLAVEELLFGTEEFDVRETTGRHAPLHQNYLGMKNSATLPLQTRFGDSKYDFSIKRKRGAATKVNKKVSDELRLVWHDYPGEWFEQEPSNADEVEDRIETFRALLGSDVALVLVDGQKILDNAGEEERYLKALFTTIGTQLDKLRDDLLIDGKPLVKFPRIWLMALTKADLLPGVNVIGFQDLLIEKAGRELHRLSEVIATFVEAPEALSVGDDFVLLSSARFEPGIMDVSKRVGLDVILPIASILPFSRYVSWALAMRRSTDVAKYLLSVTQPLAALLRHVKVPTFLAKAAGRVRPVARFVSPDLLQTVLDLAGTKVRDMNDEARRNHDFATATLTSFQLELNRADADKVLLWSRV